MLLELKAKHFKGTSYYNNNKGCAIEKAAKEHFGLPLYKISEGVNELRIENICYSHRVYGDDEFCKDKEKAKQLRYSNQLIKRIKLI